MAKNIVIVGGSVAGLSTAQRLLKSTAPGAEFKVTLITPNTHMFWGLASPRGLIPGNYDNGELFQSIAEGFKQYPSSRFQFVLGKAISLDETSQTVQVRSADTQTSVHYDILVLASGSRTPDNSPFKELNSTEETRSAMKTLQDRVKSAKSIVVAGAGVTGVEVAGELGHALGKEKTIMLVGSGARVLEDMPENVSDIAVKELHRLGVETRMNTRISQVTIGSNGKYELTTSTGSTITADLYIPTIGLVPNSSYVPAQYLRPDGLIRVNEYLRVIGSDNIYAIGDVSDLEQSQFIKADAQSLYLASTLAKQMQNQAARPYKKSTTPMMGLSVGRDVGTGHYGGWRLPNFLVAFARKTMFLEKMAPIVNGKAF